MNSPALRVVLLLLGDAEQLDKQGTQQTRVPIALVPLTAQAKILLRISTPGRSKGFLRATNPSTLLPMLSYLFYSPFATYHTCHIYPLRGSTQHGSYFVARTRWIALMFRMEEIQRTPPWGAGKFGTATMPTPLQIN